MMEPAADLLSQLASLLSEHGVGMDRLTPRPRGGRLSGDPLHEVEQALDALGDQAQAEAQSSLVYGNGCFSVGRYAEAAAVYQEVLGKDSRNVDAGFNLGLAYLRLKQAQQAANEFTTVISQRVISQDSSLAEAYYQRGNAYDDLGEPHLAVADYAEAVAIKGDYLQAFYNRGVVLARLGRHNEAIIDFDQVVELSPSISNAYLNRGASLDEIGEHDQAILGQLL